MLMLGIPEFLYWLGIGSLFGIATLNAAYTDAGDSDDDEFGDFKHDYTPPSSPRKR